MGRPLPLAHDVRRTAALPVVALLVGVDEPRKDQAVGGVGVERWVIERFLVEEEQVVATVVDDSLVMVRPVKKPAHHPLAAECVARDDFRIHDDGVTEVAARGQRTPEGIFAPGPPRRPSQ